MGNKEWGQWNKLSTYSQLGAQLRPSCCIAAPVKSIKDASLTYHGLNGKIGKSLTKRNNRGLCGLSLTTSSCDFTKCQSAVQCTGGTVHVGMANHWMGMGVLGVGG